jgi:hypothetical protein
MSAPETGLRRLIAALHNLGIRFLIGGSLASSIHGVPRATMDVDLVLDLKREQIGPLARLLGAEFYADVQALENAIDAGRSFNLIHYASSYKYDIFPLSSDPFHQMEFQRRVVVRIELPEGGALELPVATAEDTVLSKLLWYRSGGEASTRQWDDILGVLRVARDQLDMAYLREWAGRLAVAGLLDRALSEAA